MILDPSAARVAADLSDSDFLAGVDAGRWRIIAFEFPRFDFAISAGKDPQGKLIEYGFRAELSNFPAQAPMVRIWDHAQGTPLAHNLRPNGSPRIQTSFQLWTDDTVYRPWDRKTGPHSNNALNHPHLAWRPERRLSFIFQDIHGILNSNGRADRVRTIT
jgi:hypothetical protein